jgi:hypothetical protein
MAAWQETMRQHFATDLSVSYSSGVRLMAWLCLYPSGVCPCFSSVSPASDFCRSKGDFADQGGGQNDDWTAWMYFGRPPPIPGQARDTTAKVCPNSALETQPLLGLVSWGELPIPYILMGPSSGYLPYPSPRLANPRRASPGWRRRIAQHGRSHTRGCVTHPACSASIYGPYIPNICYRKLSRLMRTWQ